MSQNNSQVPWTDEQWARVNQVIQEEASRARVAATFLPLFGPLPPDSDFVRADRLSYGAPARASGRASADAATSIVPRQRMVIDDTTTILLPTLQVKVFLRGAQMADPEMSSALQMFRRAANVLARLEDAVVFNGQSGAGQLAAEATDSLPPVWEVLGGQQCRGLLVDEPKERGVIGANARKGLGEKLVGTISGAIGQLEGNGHFGPFAVVLGHKFFTAVQTPNESLVLPQDRILPFLGGGSLLRSSTIPGDSGVVVALGAAPVELVIATDVSCNFLQVTVDPMFAFRVYEKMVLRIKEPEAIVALWPSSLQGAN